MIRKHIIVYTRPNSATLVSQGNAKTYIHQISTLEKDVCS